ncbi:MAG TPA: 30S ribosomal protein S8 [Pseudomonadales bacterium]|nr:30S ribosomal protein S8 [Gammaproteobacteria bacterium]MDP6024730.1 30S ribosomal protein S8 [Pseudomonadales bacterium]MDP6317300.1 30S ribosomal protein S8 [Pseudomonadales bacterium]MDP7315461.1 30S ribosomal protein S8 [Pseudomonadales bacterium]HJL62005.1 30S ribosomal protein S8 [Pseudomonadales bacterium]
MTMQDPIADMLTRIRNAQTAKIKEVEMPSSTTKVAVAKVLKEEGYITDYSVNKENKPLLLIELKYFEGKPVIEEIQRVSRPGLRQYRGKDDIPVVKGGLGIVIVSTNKGLMSDRAAREAGVGGELVCSVF